MTSDRTPKRHNRLMPHSQKLASPMLSRRAMVAGTLAFSATACAAPNNVIGVPSVPSTSSISPPLTRRKIFIATTRAPSVEDGVFFSGERSAELNFATVEVTIPPGHVTGKVEHPRRRPPDPNKHFVIENPLTYDSASFIAETDKALRARPRNQRKVLIWVHGYNNTLADAIFRLAQFAEDSGYDGVPLLYSWASAGRLTEYVYDLNSALAARDGLVETAVSLSQSSAQCIDVIAHSMGNFLTMEAIRGQAEKHLFGLSNKVSNVVLAAPDIDIDLFAAQVRTLPKEQRRFFVLVASDDRALRLSSFISSGKRVGQTDPETLAALGVDAIDLSQVKATNSSHHTKFADAPEIVQLIGNRILAGDTFTEKSNTGFGEAIIIGANGALQVID